MLAASLHNMAVPAPYSSSASAYNPTSPPLLPSQPPLLQHSPVLSSSPTSAGQPALSVALLNGHSGRSQPVSLPATAPVAAVVSHIAASGVVPPASSDPLLLLLADGTDLSSAAVASLSLLQLLIGRLADGQGATIYAYSRDVLNQSSSSSPPSNSPSAPPAATSSLPLSSTALTFTPPAAPLSQPAAAYPRLSASSSVVLRSLPDYIRIFSQQLAVVSAAIEHIDSTVQCTRASLLQLAAVDSALAPIRAHTCNMLERHLQSTAPLWQQWQQVSDTQQSALDTFEPTITALAHIPLPVSLSGGRNGSTLLECVDERSLRDSIDRTKRDKDKHEWKRHEARRQEDDVRAAVEAVAGYGLREEEAQVSAVVDGWATDGRRECVGWMNRLMEVCDEAQRYCQQIESRLAQSVPGTAPMAELEREVRVKQMEMEVWNRRNKEEKESGVYQHLAVYKHAAAQLLSFATSLFAHHTASLSTCFTALATLASLSASLPLYQRLLTHSMDSFKPLTHLTRLAASYTHSLHELRRRHTRRQHRQRAIAATVERWRAEESDERQRRLAWWQQWGVHLPAGMAGQLGLGAGVGQGGGLKSDGGGVDSGWVKVEVCDWDGSLPVVTAEEVARVRKAKGGAWADAEESKEELADEVDDAKEEETLEDTVKRLQAENTAFKAELRQKPQAQQPTLTIPPSTPQPTAAASGSEELSSLRVEVDRRQALLNDANKTNAWLEEELYKREEELTLERARRDKSERDSREVAMKLVAAVKERTRDRARFDAAERERVHWQERCNERVTLLQPAVNDMIMAVRVLGGESDSGKERAAGAGGAGGAVPVYRVRLAGGDSSRPMFLSAETMSVMRERRSGGGGGGSAGVVWPDWVAGHVVEMVGKRATGSVREVEAGLKVNDEYWMATAALVDFTVRQSSEQAPEQERSSINSSSSSQPLSSLSSSSSSSSSSATATSPLTSALDAMVLAAP